MVSAVSELVPAVVERLLSKRLQATPMAALRVSDPRTGAAKVIGLKMESFNASGSVKDRTAVGLLRALHREAPLTRRDVIVESTSGNLGIAMADILRTLGCRFIAVIDLNTPSAARAELCRLGAEICLVDTPDASGGYLLNRLRKVQELCTANPRFRWTNQYENPANAEIHAATTGPEILDQAPTADAVYVAVSTGGTLAGISRFLHAHAPRIRICAVDAVGSVALGGAPSRRLLSGIGASRPSSFLTPETHDAVIKVADAPSFALCRVLRARTGLALGGSSGSVLRACIDDALRRNGSPHAPVVLTADGGRNYLTSFYDDEWLAAKGVLDAVRREEAALRSSELNFEFEPRYDDRRPSKSEGSRDVRR